MFTTGRCHTQEHTKLKRFYGSEKRFDSGKALHSSQAVEQSFLPAWRNEPMSLSCPSTSGNTIRSKNLPTHLKPCRILVTQQHGRKGGRVCRSKQMLHPRGTQLDVLVSPGGSRPRNNGSSPVSAGNERGSCLHITGPETLHGSDHSILQAALHLYHTVAWRPARPTVLPHRLGSPINKCQFVLQGGVILRVCDTDEDLEAQSLGNQRYR